MNKSIYEKNMATLGKKYPVWAKILRENTRKKKNFDVITEKSYTNETILKIDNHKEVYYLNGKYAPSRVAEQWLEQQGEIDKFATIIIVGISNGVHIKKIMESVPKTVNILIYEPSYEIFRRAMEEVDLSFIFEPDIPVGIIVDLINGFEKERYFRYFITYDNIVSLKIFMSGNYRELFHEETEQFIKFLNRYLTQIEISWHTIIRYTNTNAANIFHNLKYLYNGYSVADLKGILPENIPAIIVSAGPSLDKNIMELKNAVGKACIIATDTAMKPLLNAGIIPDLFVIVDGLKPAELFEHKQISKVGMVTMTAVSREPMDLHKGKKYFYYNDSPFENEMLRLVNEMDEREILLPDLPTGGSVATSAYSLGVYMGAKMIILVGQDLALTGNKVHVDGAFKNEKCEIDMKSGDYLEVESVDGGKVVTRIDFKHYLDWFEMIIEAWKNITTIDATEGGALIHGAKTMPLKRAIKKYCTKEYNARWHIARTPKILNTQEEKEYALRYFEKCVDRLKKVKEKAEKGEEYYDEMLEALKRDDQKTISSLYEKIKEVNLFMENDAVAETVMDSLKGIEFTLRPLIYQVQEDEKSELEEVAKQGKLMMMAIGVGTDEIVNIVKESLIPFAEAEKKKDEKCIIN